MEVVFVYSRSRKTHAYLKEILLSRYSLVFSSSADSLITHLKDKRNGITLLHFDSIKDEFDELCATLIEERPYTHSLVLTNTPNYTEGIKILELGCRGYINAQADKSVFLQSIDVVKSGHFWMQPEFVDMIVRNLVQLHEKIQNDDLLENLSPREKEIAYMVAQSHSNREIAECHNITERTVKAHLSSIFHKLEVKDRLGLAMLINRCFADK